MIDDTCNNYRIEFGFDLDRIDYWTEMGLAQARYPIIKEVLGTIRDFGCNEVYWFFTPHIEITWQSNGRNQELLFQRVRRVLKRYGVTDSKETTPKDGKFGDWFANSERESRWGERRYARCAELAQEFYDDGETVKTGKGRIEQVKRTIHGICNPLGLTYKQEAYICFSRGLFCLLRTMRLSQQKAQWIYTKIFRQRY